MDGNIADAAEISIREGEFEEAAKHYSNAGKKTDEADPASEGAREKLPALTPAEAAEKQEGIKDPTSVRNIIPSGHLEPKNRFTLRFPILKFLQDAHAKGDSYGLMALEKILIHAQNNISFLRTPSGAYCAPEKTKGLERDARADIFSRGAVLHEIRAVIKSLSHSKKTT